MNRHDSSLTWISEMQIEHMFLPSKPDLFMKAMPEYKAAINEENLICWRISVSSEKASQVSPAFIVLFWPNIENPCRAWPAFLHDLQVILNMNGLANGRRSYARTQRYSQQKGLEPSFSECKCEPLKRNVNLSPMCKSTVWLFTVCVALTLKEFSQIPQREVLLLPNVYVAKHQQSKPCTLNKFMFRTEKLFSVFCTNLTGLMKRQQWLA